MKIALATTTIHVPHALKLLRKCSPDVRFFVALDKKSPFNEISQMDLIANSSWLTPDFQKKWKCSELLGWNTLARRNIAFLEALKWKADIIVSWDTDNVPIALDYFDRFAKVLSPNRFDGLLGSSKTGWFDAGQLLIPWARHRGIPYNNVPAHHYDIASNYRAGIAAGLCIGNPDIDATTRMEKAPEVHNVSELAKMGVLVDVNTHTVFNSQNTAVIRELMPAWFMMPNVGRHDDLYASLIVQRVARERGLHVHFGEPLAWQERHPHNELVDLSAEIEGMKHIRQMADLLDSIVLKGRSVIEDTRIIYQTLCHCAFIPEPSARAGLAWLEDCEQVM